LSDKIGIETQINWQNFARVGLPTQVCFWNTAVSWIIDMWLGVLYEYLQQTCY